MIIKSFPAPCIFVNNIDAPHSSVILLLSLSEYSRIFSSVNYWLLFLNYAMNEVKCIRSLGLLNDVIPNNRNDQADCYLYLKEDT